MLVRVVGRIGAWALRGVRGEQVARLDQAALDPLRGGIAQKHGDEVKRMRVVFYDIRVTVHLRVVQLADCPVGEGIAQFLEAVVVAAHRTPVEGDVVCFAGGGNCVGFGQRGAETFFGVDAFDPVLGGEDDRFGTRERGGGDADDIWFFLLDHLAIIEIGIVAAEALAETRQAFLRTVGDGDDFGFDDGLVGRIMAVGAGKLIAGEFVFD